MFLTRKVSLILSPLLALCASSCMVSPGDGEHLGKFTSGGDLSESTVEFTGFTTEPRTPLAVQALRREGGWETIATTQARTYPLRYDGRTYYSWTARAGVPYSCWAFHQDLPDGTLIKAKIRVLDLDRGAPLYTFEEGFDEWFDPSVPLEEMWVRHGVGSAITLYATMIQ